MHFFFFLEAYPQPAHTFLLNEPFLFIVPECTWTSRYSPQDNRSMFSWNCFPAKKALHSLCPWDKQAEIPGGKSLVSNGTSWQPWGEAKRIKRHTCLYCASRMLWFLKAEGENLHQQRDDSLLYCNNRFIAVVWNQTRNISEVCLYCHFAFIVFRTPLYLVFHFILIAVPGVGRYWFFHF